LKALVEGVEDAFLKIPQIRFGRSDKIFERLANQWTMRYGGAAMLIAVPCVLSLLLGERLGAEFYLMLLFAAVLLAGVLGGMGPGLLATVMAAIIGSEIPLRRLSLSELHVLLALGTLVSIGGALRAGLLNVHMRIEANRQLEQQILEVSEDERRRIGHDLHDHLGQHLTGISLLSEMVTQQLASGAKPDPAKIETITRLVSEAVGITRDIAKSLSPITLELEGLSSAIMELAETSSSLFGIRCVCDYDENDLGLDQTSSLHLFRVVQEAVNNSVRHGKAKNVRIGLTRSGSDVVLTIVDDGVGLSEKTTGNPGLGLRIMQHRARILNASLIAERASTEGGTVVTCTCPLDGKVLRS
jgi:signal transduction histidine kinase